MRLAAVVESGRIYTSADGGLNWTARELVRSWYSIASSEDGSHLAAVAQGGRVYLSRDAGVTWKGSDDNRPWRAVASSADGSRLAAIVRKRLIEARLLSRAADCACATLVHAKDHHPGGARGAA